MEGREEGWKGGRKPAVVALRRAFMSRTSHPWAEGDIFSHGQPTLSWPYVRWEAVLLQGETPLPASAPQPLTRPPAEGGGLCLLAVKQES